MRKYCTPIQNFLDELKEERKNRSILQKIWDWIDNNIIDIIVDIFHPIYILNRFKWLWQQIYRGWDDRDLWSMDDSFANWILPTLLLINVGELYYSAYMNKFSKSIIAFEYIIDEDKNFNFDDYTVEKYHNYSVEVNNKIEIGLDEFFNNILEFEILIDEVADWFIPRLKEFKKIIIGCPCNTPAYRKIKITKNYESTMDGHALWQQILDKMIYTFEILKKRNYSEVEERELRKGLCYIKKYFRNLWD